MKSAHSWLIAILLLGCLALGYLSFREKAEITQINLHWGAADQDTQKRIGELQHQLAAAKSALTLADQQAAAAKEAGAPPPPKGATAPGGGHIVHLSDIIRDHPEYAALMQKQMHRNVDRMYGDSLNTLNLTPDQLSKLKDALTEKQMSALDAQQAAEAAGLERGSPAWQDAIKQASQDVESQINAILGSNADNTLAQMQARVGIQNQIDSTYKYDFAEAGATLNPDQSSALLQAMADANYAGKDLSTRPAGYNDVDPTTGLSLHDNRIIDAAAKVLTPAQVQVLTTDQVEYEKISSIMKEYNKGGGPVMFVP
jgi:hypothetical protein